MLTGQDFFSRFRQTNNAALVDLRKVCCMQDSEATRTKVLLNIQRRIRIRLERLRKHILAPSWRKGRSWTKLAQARKPVFFTDSRCAARAGSPSSSSLFTFGYRPAPALCGYRKGPHGWMKPTSQSAPPPSLPPPPLANTTSANLRCAFIYLGSGSLGSGSQRKPDPTRACPYFPVAMNFARPAAPACETATANDRRPAEQLARHTQAQFRPAPPEIKS